MIKKITDINDLSGVSSPLFPLIYCDFNCVLNDGDGVFLQLSDDEKTTALMSLKNSTLTIIKIADEVDVAEVEKYIEFFGITSVISDFQINKTEYKEVKLMCCKTTKNLDFTTDVINNSSPLQDYKSVFDLLCVDGDFYEWYPSFSKRINSNLSEAVYKKDNEIFVSTAVCNAICDNRGIISGVFTLPSYRGKGYAGECVRNLVSLLSHKGINEVYLWCENKNVKFYNNLGFNLCGEIYVREVF